MKHLVLNVYQGGREDQDRLLAACLGPAVEELRAHGLAPRFWFQRFDARGPHVFVLLGVPDDAVAEVRTRLEERLDAYLAAHPPTEAIGPDEVERRHADCRGKQLCALDAEPGMALPGSYRLAEDPAVPDPLRRTAGLADSERRWRLLGDLALWSIGQLRAGTGSRAAVLWAASADRALRETGEPAAEYWEHHACTLLLGLDERLRTDPESVHARLPGLVGERNADVFARAWERVAAEGAAWPPAGELAALLRAEAAAGPGERWRLLRELNHSVLLQLGQPVRLHLPLVLYAWLRNLPLRAVPV